MLRLIQCFWNVLKNNVLIICGFICYSVYCYLNLANWLSSIPVFTLVTSLVLVLIGNKYSKKSKLKIQSFLNRIVVLFSVLMLLFIFNNWIASLIPNALGIQRNIQDVLTDRALPYSVYEIFVLIGSNMLIKIVLYSLCSSFVYISATVDYEDIKSVKSSFGRIYLSMAALLVVSIIVLGLIMLSVIVESSLLLAISTGSYMSFVPVFSFVIGKADYELETKLHYEPTY